MKPNTRICWFGIYTPGYARNRIFLEGLRQNNITVIECRIDPSTRWRYLILAKRLWQLRHSYDVIVAAFPSPAAAIVARICSRKFLVVDAFYSMYDAVVNDRKEISRWHPRAFKLWVLDWLSLLCANLIITDTLAHKEYWSSWPLVNPRKIDVVHIGADPAQFHIFPDTPGQHSQLTIHFHGSYIPLQGVGVIVSAAALLKDHSRILFRLIGDGQDFDRVMTIARNAGIERSIEIIRRVPYDVLAGYISSADIILGIFGDSAKAMRVIPNKVYEGAAAGKPVITADNPAIREVFSPEKDIIVVSPDAQALAGAIKRLADSPELRRSIGAAARSTAGLYDPKHVAAKLYEIIQSRLS
jgi:glycosyltransferase involved in cell wall biosynthesis